jgi:hypothetical protein
LRLQDRKRALYLEDEDEEVNERKYLDAEEVKGKLPIWIK